MGNVKSWLQAAAMAFISMIVTFMGMLTVYSTGHFLIVAVLTFIILTILQKLMFYDPTEASKKSSST